MYVVESLDLPTPYLARWELEDFSTLYHTTSGIPLLTWFFQQLFRQTIFCRKFLFRHLLVHFPVSLAIERELVSCGELCN